MSQQNIMDILEERGFIHQTVNRDELYEFEWESGHTNDDFNSYVLKKTK